MTMDRRTEAEADRGKIVTNFWMKPIQPREEAAIEELLTNYEDGL